MAYNEDTAQRIREHLFEKEVAFTEKKMFMGICFMVDDKMCICTHIDKKSGEDFLLCRVGETAAEELIEQGNCLPMDMGERTMKGYVLVPEATFRASKEFSHWVELCLQFNPLAKSSKKK